MIMDLNKKLTEEEQHNILNELFGFVVEDGIVYDEEGYEFYANDYNLKFNLSTLKGIFKFVADRWHMKGVDYARMQMRIALGL